VLFIRFNYHQSLHRTHLAYPTGWQSSEWSELDHTPSNTRPDHDFRFATYAAGQAATVEAATSLVEAAAALTEAAALAEAAALLEATALVESAAGHFVQIIFIEEIN
jgi:hypothetical protein